jgi:choice-of-anchor C domain-containing protein
LRKDCTDGGGTFAGYFTGCDACRGACCNDDGTCELVTESQCGPGREFKGVAVECRPELCEDLRGACCRFESQVCERVTEDECNGRLDGFLGVGTECPEVCPMVGACCLRNEDGTPAGCGEGTQSACTEAGGFLFVPEKDCALVICPGPLECCVDVNLCGPCPINGSFEEGPEPGRYLAIGFSDRQIVGWTVVGIDYIGMAWTSSDGSRSIDLNGTPGPGEIEQTIPTVVGVRYRVSFDMAGNPEGGAPEKCMQVRAGGQSQDYCFNTQGRAGDNMGWRAEEFFFTATEAETLLEFVSLTREGSVYHGVALDNVRIEID